MLQMHSWPRGSSPTTAYIQQYDHLVVDETNNTTFPSENSLIGVRIQKLELNIALLSFEAKYMEAKKKKKKKVVMNA